MVGWIKKTSAGAWACSSARLDFLGNRSAASKRVGREAQLASSA